MKIALDLMLFAQLHFIQDLPFANFLLYTIQFYISLLHAENSTSYLKHRSNTCEHTHVNKFAQLRAIHQVKLMDSKWRLSAKPDEHILATSWRIPLGPLDITPTFGSSISKSIPAQIKDSSTN